ncbi:MAG: hypothetical protein A4E73_03522 [Syntrophaceae bacterium PtaU1.Bin231]|nr:MAG: hypothetical protein A4E73_03522 [Syntrophaceae bacterium PtaU1.Bin231]
MTAIHDGDIPAAAVPMRGGAADAPKVLDLQKAWI